MSQKKIILDALLGDDGMPLADGLSFDEIMDRTGIKPRCIRYHLSNYKAEGVIDKIRLGIHDYRYVVRTGVDINGISTTDTRANRRRVRHGNDSRDVKPGPAPEIPKDEKITAS